MPTAPISLYIDLEPDLSVELEAVSRASLAFAAGIREIAYLIDPSFEFRIELAQADDGSLWLKGALRWIRGLHHANPTMLAVTATASLWFSGNAAWYAIEHGLLDRIFKDEAPVAKGLTAEELARVAEQIQRIQGARPPDDHFKEVLRELRADRSVRGVGVSPQNDRPPPIIIPRSSFDERIVQTDAPPRAPGERRTRSARGDFVIIRPVLKEGGGKWRLSGPGGEFSATIADVNFYNSILRGEAPVPLAALIHINADLEAIDEMTPEGVWKPVSYRVTRVYSIDRQPTQDGLFSPR